jgi:hypothetical protein
MIEDTDFLTSIQKNYIDEVILGAHFPYYINDSAVKNDQNSYLGHQIMIRLEDRKEGDPPFNSPHHQQIVDIFESFVLKNKIICNEILRCSVNLTYKTNSDKCPIHQDHDYSHKQLLVYLNDCKDKGAKTVLMDESETKVLKEIIPEKFKGVYFESCPHYMIYPSQDIRVVLVYTFR